MRIALDLVAVHKGAGITLIGIADDVFGVPLGLGQKIPLIAGEEAGAAASAQTGSLDLFDHALRAPIDQHLVVGLVATHGDVFLDVGRIDNPAVAQNDLLLSLEERYR